MSTVLTGQIVRIHKFDNPSQFTGEMRLCVTLMTTSNPPPGSNVPQTRSYTDVNMDESVFNNIQIDEGYNMPIHWKVLQAKKGDIVSVVCGNLGTKTYTAKDKTIKANIVTNGYQMLLRFKAKDNMTPLEAKMVASRKIAVANAAAEAQTPLAQKTQRAPQAKVVFQQQAAAKAKVITPKVIVPAAEAVEEVEEITPYDENGELIPF